MQLFLKAILLTVNTFNRIWTRFRIRRKRFKCLRETLFAEYHFLSKCARTAKLHNNDIISIRYLNIQVNQ